MHWECLSCTTRYSVDAACCPQCGSTEYRVAGTETVDEPAAGDDTPGEA